MDEHPDSRSHQATNEYRRALRDYTQLTRHRLANPLTAITAGIEALRELDDELEPEVRDHLLAALQRTARQLEMAVLHPELAPDTDTGTDGDGDGDGDGYGLLLDGRALADLLVADAVEAEQHARTINEELFAKVAMKPEQPTRFLCECWAMECADHVTLSLADYFIVHARHDQFVIAPGHDMPSVEHVTERRDDWWVVRKTPEALRTAIRKRTSRR